MAPLEMPPSDWASSDAMLTSLQRKPSGNNNLILLWNQILWRTPVAYMSPVQKAIKILMDTAVRSRSERVVCAWGASHGADDDDNAEYSLLAPLLLAQDDSVVVMPDPLSNTGQRLGIKAKGNNSSTTTIVDFASVETSSGVTIAEIHFSYLSIASQSSLYESEVFDLGDYPNLERSLPLFDPTWSPDTGVIIFLGSLRPETVVSTVGFCDLNNICISGMLHNPGYDLVLNVSIQAFDRASHWALNEYQRIGDDSWCDQGKTTMEMREDVSAGIWELYKNYNTKEVLVALAFLISATFGAWQIQTGAFHFLFALVAVENLREECGVYRVIVQRRLRPFPKSGGRSCRGGSRGNPVRKLGGVEPFSHTLLVVSLGIVEACYEIGDDDSSWPLYYTLAVGLFWAVVWLLDMMWMVNITKRWRFGDIGIDFGPSNPRTSFEAIQCSNAIGLSRVKVGCSRYVDSEEDSAAWLTACKNPEVARRLQKSHWGCFVRGSTDVSAGIDERWILCGSMPNNH